MPETHVTDDWGVLEVKNGARLDAGKTHFLVSAPRSPTTLASADWVLTLKPGWKLVAGPRPGDFTLTKEP